jgi:hypothetical protein
MGMAAEALDTGGARRARGPGVGAGDLGAGHLQLQPGVLVARGPDGAEASIGAGGLLAVLPAHHGADRDALAQGDALLAFGATRGLTGGKTGGTVQTFAAEEALWTTRGLIQLTGAATPSRVATKPPRAGALQGPSGGDTGLTLLPLARMDTHTHQRPVIHRGQSPAGASFPALEIRGAPAVATESFTRAHRETQASEWRLTVLSSPASLRIGLELPRLLQLQDGGCCRSRTVLGPERPRAFRHDEHERHGQ